MTVVRTHRAPPRSALPCRAGRGSGTRTLRTFPRRRLGALRFSAAASFMTLAVAAPAVFAADGDAQSASAAAPAAAPEAGGADALAVQALVAEAVRNREAGRIPEARELITRALERAPGDAAAIAERDRIERITSAHQGPVPEPVQPDAELRREAALAQARTAQTRADSLAAEGRFNDAAEAVEPARATLIQLGPAGSTATLAQADHLDEEAKAWRIQGTQVANDQAHDAHARDLNEARLRVSGLEIASGEVFAERYARIKAMQDHQHYELALATCRKLVHDFPSEPRGEALFEELLGQVHEQRRLDLEERRVELRQETLERVELGLLPTGFDGMPVYPDDFAVRHAVGGALEAIPDEAPWKEALRDRLASRVDFAIDNTSGVDALTALAARAGVNVVIDAKLTSSGDHPVTIKANGMRLDHCLDWICRLMDTAWSLRDGAIYIGEAADEDGVLALHDISVLVFQGEDHPGKKLGFAVANGGNGANLFGKADATDEKPITPDDIVDLLQKAVSPLTWKNPVYGITVRGNVLFVTAPASVQRLIDEFIRAQEHTRNLMVRIDTRWLTISDDLVEEIGVNWSTAATNQNLVVPPANANGLYRQTNNSVTTANLDNDLPASAVAPNPAIAGTGLNLSFVQIGATQLAGVLNAVERNDQSRILEEPSLVTLNGVRSNMFFGEEIAYIAGYGVATGNLEAKVSVLTVGTSLDIKPMVSADHKYVTMEFKPASASVQFAEEVFIAPSSIALGTQNGVGRAITQFNDYPIELPNIFLREAMTDLRIPDKGSMLIGGFGHTVEQKTGARIPVLGDIPFIGRLFGRRGTYSDRSQLYLLTTVTIIDYDELEARL